MIASLCVFSSVPYADELGCVLAQHPLITGQYSERDERSDRMHRKDVIFMKGRGRDSSGSFLAFFHEDQTRGVRHETCGETSGETLSRETVAVCERWSITLLTACGRAT